MSDKPKQKDLTDEQVRALAECYRVLIEAGLLKLPADKGGEA